jgi:hypothetical protein
MGMYTGGMWEGMSSSSFSRISEKNVHNEEELMAGFAEYTYKSPLPT